MAKITKKNNKLNRYIIIAIILHLVLLAIIILGTLRNGVISTNSNSNNTAVLEAVMINPNAIMEQHDHEQQNNNIQRHKSLHYHKEQQSTNNNIQQMQTTDPKKLKIFTKKQLIIQEEDIPQSKILTKHQITSTKAKEQQKISADTTPIAKKKITTAHQSIEVNDLFDTLLNNTKPTKREEQQKNQNTLAKQNYTKDARINNIDINNYIGQVQSAIQDKFYNPNLFIGKTCNLRIKLAPDGALSSVQEVNGDPQLCKTAVFAAKWARIPKPHNHAIYEYFKNFTLKFKPS